MTNECDCSIVSVILCAAALVDDYELLVLSFVLPFLSVPDFPA